MGKQYAILMEDKDPGAGAATLILIRPGAACGFKVVRAWATQLDTATSAQCRVQLGRKSSAIPTTLTTVTPKKMDERSDASQFTGGTSGAAGTCGVLATSEGAGAFDPVIQQSFNNLTGWEWQAAFEELCFKANSADAFVMRFPVAASPTTSWDAGVIIEEMQ